MLPSHRSVTVLPGEGPSDQTAVPCPAQRVIECAVRRQAEASRHRLRDGLELEMLHMPPSQVHCLSVCSDPAAVLNTAHFLPCAI